MSDSVIDPKKLEEILLWAQAAAYCSLKECQKEDLEMLREALTAAGLTAEHWEKQDMGNG